MRLFHHMHTRTARTNGPTRHSTFGTTPTAQVEAPMPRRCQRAHRTHLTQSDALTRPEARVTENPQVAYPSLVDLSGRRPTCSGAKE